MGTLVKRYKKYGPGGNVDLATGVNPGGEIGSGIMQGAQSIPGIGSIVGAASSIQSGMANLVGRPNEYGNRNKLGTLMEGNAKGGTIGMIAAAASFNKNREREKAMRAEGQRSTDMFNQQQATSRIAGDPTLMNGSTGALMNGYYANGGPLNVADQQTEGGTATQLNSSAAEFNGPSHEQGGIQIPGMQAEVEGKETTNGSYVFSDRLGFAKLHKPIAKAIGNIEKKALSPERVNSIKLLKEKENQLKLSQEYTKQTLGLN